VSDLVGLVDALASDRLVVFGSLPPEGRDLDLLVPAGARPGLEAGLAEAGFLARPPHWARFRDCTADAVELHDLDAWGLPPGERDDLFAALAARLREAHAAEKVAVAEMAAIPARAG
jgi:hypothetical protein